MVNALVVAGSEKAEAATRIRARICMLVKQELTAYTSWYRYLDIFRLGSLSILICLSTVFV